MSSSDQASATSPPSWVNAFRGSLDDVAEVARALGFVRATARNVRFYQNSGIVDPPTERLGRKGLYEVVRLTQFCAALSLRRSGTPLEDVAAEVVRQGAAKLTESLWTPADPRPAASAASPSPTVEVRARRQVTALGDGLELIHPDGMTTAELHRALAAYLHRNEPALLSAPQPSEVLR